MIRKFAVLVAVVLVALGVPAVAVSASPVPDLQCGVTPTTNVRLRHDLTCPTFFDFFQSGSAPHLTITIDLGGHTLTVTGTSALALWIERGYTVTVRNGTIGGSVRMDVGSTFSHVVIHGRVRMDSAAKGTMAVSHSVVDGGFVAEGSPIVIDHDVIGTGIGFGDGDFSSSSRITDNVIHGGIAGDFSFGQPDDGGTIARNLIYGSTGAGIVVDISHAADLKIVDNLLVNNATDGITAGGETQGRGGQIGGSLTLRGNVAIANGGHGFNIQTPLAPDTFIDGGHNVAVLNKTDPQCIGVVCKP